MLLVDTDVLIDIQPAIAKRMRRLFLSSCICLWLVCGSHLAAADVSPKAEAIQFNRDVRPVLSDACFPCHGPDKAKRKADLRLDTEADARADRGGYRAVVPGKPDESELIKRITTTKESKHMPPPGSGRTLTAAQIDLLRRWVEQGAKWQPHWAYLAPQRPDPPPVQDRAWPRNAIDAFILARLEREKLTPSAEAAKTTLLRRVTLDLTGLPPTPAEVDAFLADPAPDAYEKVVDRLLASPRYGERMAWEWLDAARYADSNGYQTDRTRTLWPWRDWVIDALNRNLPYDQFTVEQLAGDLLPNATVAQKVATGFHRNHPLNGEGGRIAEESRVDYVVDRVDTTATVWLGLTLGCSRCHDHKYDPFTQKEYYQLFAYFNNVAETGAVDRGGNANPVLRLPTPEQAGRLRQLAAEIADLEKRLKDDAAARPPAVAEADVRRAALGALLPGPGGAVLRLPEKALAGTPERRALFQQLTARRAERDRVDKAVVETMVMEERPQPRDTHVLVRGAWDRPGEKVRPGTPAALPAPPEDAPPNRLGLARWLVDPANPLTTRVAVNRAWQTFFGTGLVKTAEDFGVQSEPPSHQELLDWLAAEFVRGGWDAKALHRLIVTSATYRQASRLRPGLGERDPDNRLLARGPRHRLPAWVLRDQALALSGLLVERPGGPPVKPYQPPGIWEEMSFGLIKYQPDRGPSLYRRSVYTFWRRTVGPPNLFDTSARQVCTVRQPRTNTPLHALTLLNDVTYVEAARVLAGRALTPAGLTADERAARLFRLATARDPSAAERKVLGEALGRLLQQYGADRDAAAKLVSAGEYPRDTKLDVAEHAACTALVNLLFNLDEVLCKE